MEKVFSWVETWQMTMEEYEAEKARLTALYGNASRDAMQKRAQAFARFYAQSGWNERQLAEMEKYSQSRMHQCLLFGRFLLNTQGVQNAECTEKHFRTLWQSTDKTATEQARFAAVAALLDEAQSVPAVPTTRGSKRLANQIIERFADQRWHNLSVIYQRLDASHTDIHTVLDAMRLRGAYHTMCERRRATKDEGGWQYKITKHHGQRISYGVLVSELAPILQGLKEQGQKSMATMSPGSVARLAHELERLLEKLAQ